MEKIPEKRGLDEDLALIETFVMPIAIVTCLLALGLGFLICL